MRCCHPHRLPHRGSPNNCRVDKAGEHVVVAHGAGSSPEVASILLPAGLRSRAHWTYLRDRSGDVDTVADLARQEAEPGAAWLMGISLGAHAMAILSAERSTPAPHLFALPAWIGEPNATAHLTQIAGDNIAHQGIDSCLRHIAANAAPQHEWITSALTKSWPTYSRSALSSCLHSAAHSRGPSLADLESIIGPTLIIGMADDPFHPHDVARQWAECIPQSHLVILTMDEMAKHGSFATPTVADILSSWT